MCHFFLSSFKFCSWIFTSLWSFSNIWLSSLFPSNAPKLSFPTLVFALILSCLGVGFFGFGMDVVVPLEDELSSIVAWTGIAWGRNLTRGWRQFCVCWGAWTRWISRENISLFWRFCFCKVTPLSMLKIDYCKRIHVVR